MAVIVIGIAAAVVSVTVTGAFAAGSYRLVRQRVGKAILLGLELLVAADIIRTVAVTPTLRSAAVLALIVLIRTSLSFSLEVELEGRWPWHRGATADSTVASPANTTH
ncbi:MAG: DUF1622 domain-containing protein [Ilumatobacteraceae bacterium]